MDADYSNHDTNANPGTHTFRVRMILTEPNGTLFPGMLVKVSVPVGEWSMV